ncbi:MAG: DUF885 domain-containing protein [Pseudomonadota bacterium]
MPRAALDSRVVAVFRAVLVTGVAAVLAGCATPPDRGSGAAAGLAAPTGSTAAAAAPAAAGDLEAYVRAADVNGLVERWFEESLALSPVGATFIGDSRFDDRLGNPASLEFRRATDERDQRYLAAASRIDPARLEPSARLTHEIFLRDLRLAIAGRRFPSELLPVSQMDSLYATLAVLGSGTSAQPFGTPAQHAAWLKRAAEFPAWADSAIERLREGLARGVTHPRPVAAKLLPQLDQLIAARPEDSVFWGPVRMLEGDVPPAGFTTADRERLAGEYRVLIGTRLMPALRKLRAFLADEYLPNARTTVGWSALPDGARWYSHLAEVSTTVRMEPAEIHATGLAEVGRIRAEMEAVKRQVGFDGDLQAFFRHLQTDPRYYYERTQDLIAGYREIKARVDAALPKLFRTFPKADYEVREVEPFRAQSAAGAMYQPPSEDGRRPGIFYVNTYHPKAQPRFGMETLSLHEAAPGHHFQIAIQQELKGLPRIRRFEGNVAYVEGWALYAESLGRELGLFTDPYQWYGRLSDEMLRAMRLVVDTGLHAKGWSREQAIRYMLDNSSLAESDVVAEVERYIVWPGQALGYKIGQLRMSALRAEAERELGPRFDVRAFHDELLKDGALPIEVLEAKVRRWIAGQKAGN